MTTLYSVASISFSASSNSWAVSTRYPCREKYSLIEKQIDSSSSTTSSRGISTSSEDLSSLPAHIRLSLPETFFSVPKGLCFTADKPELGQLDLGALPLRFDQN